MHIKESQFCFLSTSPFWQSWLFDYDRALYDDLANMLQTKTSCRANSEKMLAILKTIRSRNDEGRLISYLQEHFPQTVTAEPILVKPEQPTRTAASVSGIAVERTTAVQVRKTPVFGLYDSRLFTLPARAVIDGPDAEHKAREFLKGKSINDYVIVDGVAYVEYVPLDYVKYINKLTDDHWLTRKWRKKTRS